MIGLLGEQAPQNPADRRQDTPATLGATKDSELQAALDEFLGKAGKRKKTLEADVKEAKKQLDLRKDHLGKAKLVVKLKDHRHDLKSGEPCPLCGALEHPYAEGAAPNPEIAELASEVEKASEKLEGFREVNQALSTTVSDLASKCDDLISSVRDCGARLKGLEKLLKPLATQPPAHGDEDTLRSGLQGRELAYRNHVNAENKAAKRKAEAERAAKAAGEEAKNLEKRLKKLEPLPADLEFEPVAVEDLPEVHEAEEAHAAAILDENAKAT